MANGWPNARDLRVLQHEANEHARAWRVVYGLARELEDERGRRRGTGEYTQQKHDEHVERIRDLEAKVIAQKAHLRQLEDCRAFEAETEEMLARALRAIINESPEFAQQTAQLTLNRLAERKGPRPA